MFTISIIHIAAGTAAFFAGVIALGARKGQRWHRRAGQIFTLTMFATAIAGFLMALIQLQAITALAGLLAASLVLTGWLSIRPAGVIGRAIHIVATVTVIGVSIGTLTIGVVAQNHVTGTYQSFAAGDYFYLAAIALLAAGGDVYWFAVGGYTGKRRLARHLWRMCTGMLFATGSLFTGPGANVFPQALQDSGLLALPELTVLVIMVYWLLRVMRS